MDQGVWTLATRRLAVVAGHANAHDQQMVYYAHADPRRGGMTSPAIRVSCNTDM